MKISIFVGVLLLSAAVLSVDGLDPRVQKFINQHINQNMAPNRCDAMITQKKISQTNSNRCKEVNTFISATYAAVKPVCRDGGSPYGTGGNLRISHDKFRVVNCECNVNLRLPNCDCRGSSGNKRIVIGCDDTGNPVHYEEGVYIPN
ncbi:ribonuclease-like 3 [Sander lucioperca]|uniref:ribonuclease-like 3 n=1 Tax=Sander lucioperca TaxID=283035 RepID=UPI0016536125|nr:ribonuclease-like 3 [Sander lucioperca]